MKDQLLKSLQKRTFCRLAPSQIHGVGVFAIIDIPKGSNPFEEEFEFDFIPIPSKEIKESQDIPPAVKQLVKDFCVEDEGVYYLPEQGLNGIGIAWYLNHSTIPNMEAIDHGEKFISIREIKAGEELTVNYGTYGEENLLPF